MPQNFIQRSFIQWLADHRHCFCRYPIAVKYRKGGVSFILNGAPNGISVCISRIGASVLYEEHGKVLDILAYFDIV